VSNCGRGSKQGCEEVFEQEWRDHLPLFEQVFSVDLLLCLKAIEMRRAATARLPTIDSLIAPSYKCSGGDLNPHAFRHTPLKRTCLPFHHPSESGKEKFAAAGSPRKGKISLDG
jgi:hypothetical protein